MLKKAAELSILCGVKVTLVFTDLNNTVHTYSNNSDIKWVPSQNLKKEVGDPPFFINYTNVDVRLISLAFFGRIFSRILLSFGGVLSGRLGSFLDFFSFFWEFG